MFNINKDISKLHFAWGFCFTIILLGVIVRTNNYLFADLSFWNDEAALALNFQERSFLDFFKPLDYSQVAPIGFCLLEKVAMLIFGDNELAFRSIPFIAGISAIGLVFLWVRNSAGLLLAILCVMQLAVIREPIYYAGDFKPYATDLAIASGLILLAWDKKGNTLSINRLLTVMLAGIIAIWLSFPAVFILSSIGALWIFDWSKNPSKKIFWILIAIFALWLINFWWQFQFLQAQTKNAYMINFWGYAFMPLPPTNMEDLAFFSNLPKVFRNPLWVPDRTLASIMFICGCIALWIKKRRLCILILTPLLLNLLASGLHKYPFGGRLLQYATMHLFFPIAFCLVFLFNWAKKMGWQWAKVIVILLALWHIAEPTMEVVKQIAAPHKEEQMKQVVQRLVKHSAKNLPYYIFGNSNLTFMYYKNRMGLTPQSITVGPGVEEKDPLKMENQILKLHGRYWLIFGHGKQSGEIDYEKIYLNAADKRGKLLDKITEIGAAAYLYHFP